MKMVCQFKMFIEARILICEHLANFIKLFWGLLLKLALYFAALYDSKMLFMICRLIIEDLSIIIRLKCIAQIT